MNDLRVLRYRLRGGGHVVVINNGYCYMELNGLFSSWAVSRDAAQEIFDKFDDGKSLIKVYDGAFSFMVDSTGDIVVRWKATVLRGKVVTVDHIEVFKGAEGEEVF